MSEEKKKKKYKTWHFVLEKIPSKLVFIFAHVAYKQLMTGCKNIKV